MRIAKKDLLSYHVKRVPRCATQEQFQEWRKAAAFYKPPYNIWFCQDCTPSFQRYNLKKGTCDHEYVQFYTKNGEIEGFIPQSQAEKHNQRLLKYAREHEPGAFDSETLTEITDNLDGSIPELRSDETCEQDLRSEEGRA